MSKKTKDKQIGAMDAPSRMSFFTTEKLGPKQSLTPEGFLLCEEVPLARAGFMIYGPDETPIKPGPEGFVKIFREPEDIFRPETIASAQGKPVTNDHPDDDVVPDTWKELAKGVMMNVRPGIGAMDDLLIGDLLVTTPEGIKAIRSGKVEVSLGYEADYEETAPGTGKQSNIIINHIALVDQGRCGPRCAISDHALNQEQLMKTKDKKSKSKDKKVSHGKIHDFFMRAFKAKDAEEVNKIAEEAKDEMPFEEEDSEGDTHIHIHTNESEPESMNDEEEGRAKFTGDDELQDFIQRNDQEHQEMRSRLDALEAFVAKLEPLEEEEHGEAMDAEEMEEAIKDEAPEGLEEQAAKAKDSAYMVESFRDTAALAEILVPGIKIPTFDRASSPANTMKSICGLRRNALDKAYDNAETRAILNGLFGNKKLNTKKMTCDAVRTAFKSAASMKQKANKSAVHDSVKKDNQAVSSVKSPADLNKRLASFYGRNN